jgi:hypothetical protein
MSSSWGDWDWGWTASVTDWTVSVLVQHWCVKACHIANITTKCLHWICIYNLETEWFIYWEMQVYLQMYSTFILVRFSCLEAFLYGLFRIFYILHRFLTGLICVIRWRKVAVCLSTQHVFWLELMKSWCRWYFMNTRSSMLKWVLFVSYMVG